MRQYPLYILDLDGTLYRGDETITGAVDTVRELRGRGVQVRFLTNNSGQTREFYQAKLERMGFAPSPNEIYSSAIGAARWLKENSFRKVFYVGEPGLAATLKESGLELVNDNGKQAEAVVAGICRSFTYDWMNQAMQQILGGARFVATNTDATYPVENGRQVPGAGSIAASIQTCSEQAPFVIGKPNPYLIELILADAGVAAADALVVGDRLETDIESGKRAGCPTHLVLTGVAKSAPVGQSVSVDLRGLL